MKYILSHIHTPSIIYSLSAALNINFNCVPSCFLSKQDYATFSYLDLIIKASLSLDGSAQNIILKNAETEVSL